MSSNKRATATIKRGLSTSYYLANMDKYLEFPPSVKYIKEVFMRAMELGLEDLGSATMALRDCEDVVMCAIDMQGGAQLSYASKRVKQIHKVVINAFASKPLYVLRDVFIHLACDRPEDRPLFESAVRQGAFELLHQFTDDKEMAMIAVHADSNDLKYVSLRLSDDIDVVMCAINSSTERTMSNDFLKYASDRLRGNAELCLCAIGKYCWSFKYVKLKLRQNRNFVLSAVKLNAHVYQLIPAKFEDDREIALLASLCNGNRLMEFSDEMKKDKDIIMNIISNPNNSFSQIPSVLRSDFDVVLKSIPLNGFTFSEITCFKLRANKNIILTTHLFMRDSKYTALSSKHIHLCGGALIAHTPCKYNMADIVVCLRVAGF